MKRPAVPQQLSFRSKLERIAVDMEYYALPVPAKVTAALGTHGPVLVSARVSGSTPFQVSLYPVGGGRHYIRIKARVRTEVGLKGGDPVRVQITVVDRASVPIPPDLASALNDAGAMGDFKSLPPGKRAYAIRLIEQAAKPGTRAKRIADAVKLAGESRK